MKRTSLLVLVLLVGAIVLSACSAPATTTIATTAAPAETQPAETTTSAEPITLSFWNGFTGPDGEILKQIVERFNETNDKNITIKMDVMGWDVLGQKLPTAIATDTAPDMALLIGDTIPQYINEEALQNMDDFWSATGLNSSNYVKSVLDAGVYNGKTYALPMQFNLIYLYWNKQLFKDAGLDPETPPTTMEELADYAVKLTDSSKNQFGFGMPVKGAPQYWTSFFWNNGGDLFDTNTKKSLLNSPENISTLAWMQDLAMNKKVTPTGATGADTDALMTSGQLGMYINGPWLINGLKSGNIDFGITVPPKGPKGQSVISGQIGFVIPSSNTKTKIACYEFIKYWMSDEIMKEWSLKNGFPAWSNSVLADPDIQNDPIQSKIASLSSLGRAYNPGAFTAVGSIDNDALWPMIEAALTTKESPNTLIENASSQIEEIFANN